MITVCRILVVLGSQPALEVPNKNEYDTKQNKTKQQSCRRDTPTATGKESKRRRGRSKRVQIEWQSLMLPIENIRVRRKGKGTMRKEKAARRGGDMGDPGSRIDFNYFE